MVESKPYLTGPFVKIPRVEIIELLAFSGFDFAVVDLEHAPIMPNEVYPLILAAERHGIKLIARTPGLQENFCKWLLDLGISGLQIPHIETAADARNAVSYSRFSPDGERGLCRFVRAAEFSNIPKETYVQEANSKSALILQIEGKEGVDNIEEIIKVPGIDVIFVGPYDLSQSLGLIGQIWHEKVTEAITGVIRICNEANIHVGVFTDTPEGVKHWKDLGVKYINYRTDVELILSNIKSHVQEIHKLV